jgi:release factor glutamine methyltransferase
MVTTRKAAFRDFVPVCTPTVGALMNASTSFLAPVTAAPRLEAELLLARVLACSRTHLYAHPEQRLSPRQQTHFQHLVSRRAAGEPLPYLTGEAQFFGLDVWVDPRVLIPRPETETLVELAQTWLVAHETPAGAPTVVDVGTGSGAIAISLAVHHPRAKIYAVDVSTAALHVARANAKRHNVYHHITFLLSDLLDALPEPVDLIVSNPPYIAGREWADLPFSVREHEPRLALDGGAGGLEIIQRLLVGAALRLRPHGALLIEIGAAQGLETRKAARDAFPHAEVQIVQDLADRDRVLSVHT